MNARRTLRVGLVGAGYIAGVHSAAWRAVAGTFPELDLDIELAEIADADLSRAEAQSRAWGWERARPDWTELTTSEKLDVVDICVPNDLHGVIAVDALSNGKHVVCEKPLAIEADDARSMVEAARRPGLLAQVCFYYRLWPAIAHAQQIVASGQVGTVQHFRGWMLQDYASDPKQSMGWRADRARGGAGAVADLGSHIADIARALVGEIDSVCALRSRLSTAIAAQAWTSPRAFSASRMGQAARSRQAGRREAMTATSGSTSSELKERCASAGSAPTSSRSSRAVTQRTADFGESWSDPA